MSGCQADMAHWGMDILFQSHILYSRILTDVTPVVNGGGEHRLEQVLWAQPLRQKNTRPAISTGGPAVSGGNASITTLERRRKKKDVLRWEPSTYASSGYPFVYSHLTAHCKP
ncbi:MAG: hypothetical protein M1133_15365 [Armatimonadetes bacterium]|nr:hypothetical protein [Armatimonadota bacterium]